MSRHAPSPRRRSGAGGGFRAWRGNRPFWGGLLVTLSGIIIVLAPLAPLPLVIHQGIAGISGYIVGLLLIALGLLTWFQPMQRSFFGIVALLLSLASFVTSNFGGFVIGMLLGLIGGALTFAWVPDKRSPAPTEEPDGSDPEPTGVEGDTDDAQPPENSDGSEDATPPAEADQDHGSDHDPDDDGPAPRRIVRDTTVHAFVALPMALAMLSPAMVPADEGPGWPWEWGDDEEESDSGDSDSPTVPPTEPPESPSPSPGETGDPEDENGDDAADSNNEDADDEEDDEENNEETDCEIATGDESVAESEDEFLEAVETCQQAQEDDELPDVDTTEAEGDFNAATVPMGLTSEKQTMYGATFEGVVEYPTAEGTESYLKLSMDKTEFTGAEQWYELGGSRTTLALPDMTFTDEVVIHVTEMDVSILGIPLTFTPDFPPPLLLPVMSVTNVDVAQPVAQADEVVIDGLDQRVEQ